jgi:hypothetical protein
MRSLEAQDVVELLRREIDRVGGQSEWARQTGIERSLINKVVNRRKPATARVRRALRLEWVIARQVAQRNGQTKPVAVDQLALLQILWKEIEKAGSISVWSQQMGIDRTYLSRVLHRRRPPNKKIIAALNLSKILVCANELKRL